MSDNFIRRVLEYAISYLDIVPGSAENNEDVAAVRQMLDAYDALAPDWANAPDWAQWYAIDASGSVGLFGQEPEIEDHIWVIEWTEESDLPVEKGTVELPIGIDWRLCKWSREVTK